MLKFMITFKYSSASWARMLKIPEDRASAVSALMEHLQGSLESIYWEVRTASAFVTCNLPDSVSAAAVLTAAERTGAFREVQVHEVLTAEQLSDATALARSSEDIYQAPGLAALSRDL
jgi:uncharacterized protein with GYD domain